MFQFHLIEVLSRLQKPLAYSCSIALLATKTTCAEYDYFDYEPKPLAYSIVFFTMYQNHLLAVLQIFIAHI